jgi:hypothetical protein
VVTLAFVGDTLLGGQFTDLLRARGYASALEGIAPLLVRADLTVANLEGALTAETRALGNPCRPVPIRDDAAIPVLRSLTSERDGWREHGYALRLDLPKKRRDG